MLTGMYTTSIGMGHHIVTGNQPYGLPLDLATLPQYLAVAGYKAVMLGKWHLGHFKHAHLPLQRGFDAHVGFYSGFQDHFSHVSESSICEVADAEGQCFLDLRSGTEALDTSSWDDELAYGPALWMAAFDDAVARVARGSGDASEGKPLFVCVGPNG